MEKAYGLRGECIFSSHQESESTNGYLKVRFEHLLSLHSRLGGNDAQGTPFAASAIFLFSNGSFIEVVSVFHSLLYITCSELSRFKI